MMFALGLALQVAAGSAAQTLVVRDARQSLRVPTISTENGPMLRPEALRPLIAIDVKRDSMFWYTLNVWNVRLGLEIGVPVVRVGGEARPLAAAPIMKDGHLLIPLQLLSEVFPSVVPNTRWDADSSQLVLFTTSIPGASPDLPRRTVASDDAPRARPAPDPRNQRPAERRDRWTVIVDAGHGGVDNGMTGPIGGGPKIYEKDITLAVARKLGAVLKRQGVDVVYTRTSDTLIALDDRGRIANREGGDLFISIHVNAANPTWKDPGGARGYETYFLSEAKTEDARRVEQMENAAVRFEEAPVRVAKDDPLGFILSDMKQNEHLRESSDLADLIQQRLGTMHPGPSRGVKQAGFRVLVTAYMPAVLVEIGFGTNPREAQFLSDQRKQDSIAGAVAGAAMEYLDRYARRVSGSRPGAGMMR
jgi:N-acetylmuramoyl-L-alanine amidase